MIISRTPYRISLAGGGSDLPGFYQQERGTVISLTIQRYIYVFYQRTTDGKLRLNYGDREVRERLGDVRHDLIRETLASEGVNGSVDITIRGELPWGTGLGSSSALAVGLLHALSVERAAPLSPEFLARRACELEIDILGKPIGRQDQYAAAYGGVNRLDFHRGHRVDLKRIDVGDDARARLESNLFLIYTGTQRLASEILAQQVKAIDQCLPVLRKMRDLAEQVSDAIEKGDSIDTLGALLDAGWQLKRSMGFGIATKAIDTLYQTAREAGASGGKLVGAGGGGFILLVAPPSRHQDILDALGRPMTVPVRLDESGSQIVIQNQAALLGTG